MNEIDFDEEEIKEAVLYQQCRIPHLNAAPKKEVSFNYNFPRYFDTLLTDFPEPLLSQPQKIIINQTDFQGNKQEFSREVVLWGRKSGTNLTKVETI